MEFDLLAPDVPQILAASGLLFTLTLILGFVAYATRRVLPSTRQIGMAMVFAPVLTLASLLFSYERYAGEGKSRDFGWPHFFYNTWHDLSNTIYEDRGFVFGPLCSYLASNVVFYFSFICLGLVIYRLPLKGKH
jgi:hypothetical protein